MSMHSMGVHHVAMHDVGLHSVKCLAWRSIKRKKISTVKQITFDALSRKNVIFFYYILLNYFFQIKRWGLIEKNDPADTSLKEDLLADNTFDPS
jgi:hypothetical protein